MPELCHSGASQHALYPLFIDLDGQDVVVVGAGAVALRKIETLLDYGAHVRVVAPEVCDGIRSLARAGRIELDIRPFADADLQGALFVIAATASEEVNTSVFQAAQQRGTLVNVVDVPDLCTAAVPSVLKRGLLQIAVSTSGAAPSLARHIRSDLEADFPVWWEDYVQLLSQTRALVKERIEGPAAVRTPLFEALTDGRLQARIAAGEQISATQAYEDYVAPLLSSREQSCEMQTEQGGCA